MGLLDEAIREHLELKRRRGADPSAVAREEQEALAPVLPDAPMAAHAESDSPREEADSSAAAAPTEATSTPYAPDPAAVPLGLSEETAELDMQAVIEQDPSPTDHDRETSPEAAPGQERMSFE